MAGDSGQDRRIENLINGFKLIQSGGRIKLGMDAVMLSAFLSPSKALDICELGCGEGAVSILLAARYPAARIDGVEIQRDASSLFHENIVLNGLGDRVRSVKADMRLLDGILPAGSYTAVVCNPPYFRRGQGKAGASSEKRVERSEAEAGIEDVCIASARLLKNNGELALVFRAERLMDAVTSMRRAGVEPKRLRFIHHSERSPSKLFLISGRKGARPGIATGPPLIIRTEAGDFSDEYFKVYGGENI